MQVVESLASHVSQYPFLAALSDPITRLREIVGKEYSFYLTALPKQTDELLDMKEDVLDPIMQFMSGSPKSIFDEIRSYLQEQAANFSYVPGDESQQLRDILVDDNCFKSNRMQQAKSLMDSLRERVKNQIEKEQEEAIAAIQILADRLYQMDDFKNLTTDDQLKLSTPFQKLEQEIQQQKLIAVIRDRLRSFEEGEYARLLAEVGRLTIAAHRKKDETQQKPKETGTGTPKPPETHEPEPEYIVGRTIKVNFAKPALVDEHDVDEYLDLLRKAYLKEISAGKRVQI